MNLDELKSEWQQTPAPKSEAEIQQMVSRKTSFVLSRTRLKALIETIAFIILLLVFMIGLDPERNPGWVNALLLVVVGLGILNNLWLYRSLPVNAHSDDLKTSLRKAKEKLWQQILFAGVFSALFFGSVLLFLLMRVPLTPEKAGWVFLLLALSVGLRTGTEVWRWSRHVRQLDHCLAELIY